MPFPEVRGLVALPVIPVQLATTGSLSGVIDREDFHNPQSVLFLLHNGTSATTMSATDLFIFEHDPISATASGGTAITSGNTSALTFTTSGIIGLEIDLRGKGRFIGCVLCAPTNDSSIQGLTAIMGDGNRNPPTAATDGMISVRRIGQ